MNRGVGWFALVFACLVALPDGFARADDLAKLLATIRGVEAGGQGNREAARAWRQLTGADADSLVPILLALDDANPLAANWLRSAAETIAQRQLEQHRALPVADLETLVLDTSHDPRGRRLAFELLTSVDPSAPDRLIPGMMDDPAREFRRDAVDRQLAEADALLAANEQVSAGRLLLRVLDAARDQDQTELIAARLASLGQPVDLATHFGFVQDWQLIGPFDNAAHGGFDHVFPPEIALDLSARLAGKQGDVGWTAHVTSDERGVVDLVQVLGPHKSALAYATSDFTSDAEREVELRLGSANALKVWVNSRLVLEHDEYHVGMEAVIDGQRTMLRPVLDKFRVPVTFRQGENSILLKVCQNEQTEDWAQRWEFQLRVCDSTGAALLSTTRPPSPRHSTRNPETPRTEQNP